MRRAVVDVVDVAVGGGVSITVNSTSQEQGVNSTRERGKEEDKRRETKGVRGEERGER